MQINDDATESISQSRRALIARAAPALAAALSVPLAPSVFAQAASVRRGASAAEALSPLALVNLSGRQRSLVLRAARSYAQLGAGITPSRSSEVLKATVGLFESTSSSLRRQLGAQPSNAMLADADRLWAQFSPLLRAAPSRESMTEKNALLEQVVAGCSRAHEQVVKEVGSQRAALISRLGRQRFLSQRAAQLFMYREWGVTRGDYADIAQLSAEYKTLKRDLVTDRSLSEAIRRDINLAETQWIFFEDALKAQQAGKADDIARRNVASTSDRLFELFDTITASSSNAA